MHKKLKTLFILNIMCVKIALQATLGFVQVGLDGIRHQHLYYYLTSVPARQNAIEQKNKTST